MISNANGAYNGMHHNSFLYGGQPSSSPESRFILKN